MHKEENKGTDITPLENWIFILNEMRDLSRRVFPPDEFILLQRKMLETVTDCIIARLEKELENEK